MRRFIVILLFGVFFLPQPAVGAKVECSPKCAQYVTGVVKSFSEAVERHNLEIVDRHYKAFLVCTRAHESDTAGGYAAVSPGGTYRGAYQFSRSTWLNTKRQFGRWWVHDDPALASVADQDLLADDLYQWQGNSPWGGRC